MRSARRLMWAGTVALGTSLFAFVPSARAQGGGLGGYGAMSGGPDSSMGAGSTVLDPSGMGAGTTAPLGGRAGAGMPTGMGGGGGLGFRPRPAPSMASSTRAAFTVGPMGGAMSGGMGMGLGSSRRPFALQGLGPGGGSGLGGMRRSMAAPRGMGVMPPSFGSPFRQPPSLLAPSSPGAGMSM